MGTFEADLDEEVEARVSRAVGQEPKSSLLSFCSNNAVGGINLVDLLRGEPSQGIDP